MKVSAPAMEPRTAASILLVLVGIVACTTGAALWHVEAGIIVFGVLMLVLGVLLGFA